MTNEQITEVAKGMAECFLAKESPETFADSIFLLYGADLLNHREEIDRQYEEFIEAHRIDQLAYLAALCFKAGVSPDEFHELRELLLPGLAWQAGDFPAVLVRGSEILKELRPA